MNYLITNQNRFNHIPYPSKGNPKATVKSGGCGACSALMVVENMTPNRINMKDWIAWVISTGARVSGGTDMATLSRAVAKKYGFNIATTSSETTLKNHLKSGGMAIANVGGKRSGWAGIFSDGGHFITVLGLTSDGRFIIGDSGNYSGKFAGSFRKARTQVSGDLVYINTDNLHLDTLTRTPNYYLFTKTQEENTVPELRYQTYNVLPSWGKEAVSHYMTLGTLKGDGNGNIDLSHDMLRTLCIVCPKVYKRLEDCPQYAQATVKKLVDEGALKGDGNGNLNLTLEMIRTFVVDDGSIA